VAHSLSCPHGAFPSIRHDRVWGLTANLLTEVCHGVEIKPHLQPLTVEQPSGRSAINGDNARQDIKAMGFWGNSRQQTFFDVRIFNPVAPSNSSDSLWSTYKKHERGKRREYEHRIREIEHGTCTPIVLATTGGWVTISISDVQEIGLSDCDNTSSPYNQVMRIIRHCICFALIDASIMCLRGARSSLHHPKRMNLSDSPIDLFDNVLINQLSNYTTAHAYYCFVYFILHVIMYLFCWIKMEFVRTLWWTYSLAQCSYRSHMGFCVSSSSK